MEFEEKWFEAETREDFYVEGMMKRAWAAQMEVLKDIEKICQKYGLTYFADWGTLLGTVRHKGFIPWDDDMDIAMKRCDYEVFLQVAAKELPQCYQVKSPRNSEKWSEPFVRVINGPELSFAEDRMKKFHRCPYCVGIDIFPLDYLPRDKREADILCNFIKMVLGMKLAVGDHTMSLVEQEENIKEIETLCNVQIDRNKNIENQLARLIEQLSQCYSEEESDELAELYEYAVNGHSAVKKESYDAVVWMPFENIKMPVPQHYDACLRSMYGEDYMIPRKIYTHDYPFYKKQAEEVLKVIHKKKKELQK